ncbi:MAG: metal-dependent hydrolase [Halobacteriales archaeon]|nr:metal-dependent hydrolase [Halobacteriales archaeon]
MYIGHELLAIALATGLARAAGVGRQRALLLGGFGGVYAFAPDLDLAYTIWAVLKAGPTNVFPTTEHVWTKSWIVHRSLTHSIVTGTVAVLAVGLFGTTFSRYRAGSRDRYTVMGLLSTVGAVGTLGWIVILSDELLGLLTLGLYVAVILATTAWGIGRGIAPRQLMAVAAIGLWTHPFGDVFTGRPPTFLYPIQSKAPFGKIAVAADPTVNLIGLFGLELLIAWAALLVVLSVGEYRLGAHLRPRAILGLGFAATVTVIRPPTLEVAYHFALGTIATGVVLGALPHRFRSNKDATAGSWPARWLTPLVTALAGASLAVIGYLVAYLLIGVS